MLRSYRLILGAIYLCFCLLYPSLAQIQQESEPNDRRDQADEIRLDETVYLFNSQGCPFTLMHCVMKYPCPDFSCDLGAIKRLKRTYNHPVGYSCHHPAILTPPLAVCLGAEAIEVHITLDRTMYGSDQSASFEKKGLEYVVRDCRLVKDML